MLVATQSSLFARIQVQVKFSRKREALRTRRGVRTQLMLPWRYDRLAIFEATAEGKPIDVSRRGATATRTASVSNDAQVEGMRGVSTARASAESRAPCPSFGQHRERGAIATRLASASPDATVNARRSHHRTPKSVQTRARQENLPSSDCGSIPSTIPD